jgi:hypothetical protein
LGEIFPSCISSRNCCVPVNSIPGREMKKILFCPNTPVFKERSMMILSSYLQGVPSSLGTSLGKPTNEYLDGWHL